MADVLTRITATTPLEMIMPQVSLLRIGGVDILKTMGNPVINITAGGS